MATTETDNKRMPERRPVRWFKLARALWFDLDDKNMFLISAGVAFYSILAMFPAIAAVVALWGLVADPAVVATEVERFRTILPVEVYDLVDQQISQLINGNTQTLGWASTISFLLAIWTSRAGVAALMRGLNAIYGQPNRKGLSHYIRAVLLTFALIGVSLVALASVVVVPIVMTFVPVGTVNNATIEALRWMIAVVVLYCGVSVVYRMGPNRRQGRMKWFTPGSFIATFLWTAASVGFSVYLTNFGNYNEIYGSIGAVIALLVWLFISAFLVLFGGAINAHIERERYRRYAGDT